MTMKYRGFATLLVLAFAAPVAADRYVCQWGSLPPSYVPDSIEMAINLDGARGGLTVPTVTGQSTIVVPVAPAPLAVTVAADPTPLMSRVVTTPATTLLNMPSRPEDIAPSVNTPPQTQEFRDAVARVYSASVQAEVDAIWRIYQNEPTGLPVDQRVGNSVVRFIVALGRAPGADSSARPDLLKATATRGTVRSANGVGVRSAPWGPPGGAALGSGASVEIIPPANGPWYQVRTGGGTGWVAGLWLDLQ